MNDIDEIIVVVPYYKTELELSEQYALNRIKTVFKNRKIVFVGPRSIVPSYLDGKDKIMKFDDSYFDSVQSYNSLLLNSIFWQKFSLYKYVLICQLDVFVFRDELSFFCSLDYDYIGAFWPNGIMNRMRRNDILYVGNGGYSLRKVQTCLEILNKYNNEINDSYNEDIEWCIQISKKYRLAPIEIARKFAFETLIREQFEIEKSLPTAIHAYIKYDYDFLKPYITKLGYETDLIVGQNMDISIRKESKWRKLIKLNPKRFHSELFSIIPNNKNIIIWGCGQRGFVLANLFIEMAVFFSFVDANEKKIGENIWGKIVKGPDVITKNDIIIISPKYKYESIISECQRKRVQFIRADKLINDMLEKCNN